MLSAQSLLDGRGIYHDTHIVTWGIGFFGLIRWTAPFNCPLRLAMGCRTHPYGLNEKEACMETNSSVVDCLEKLQ
jgi:hypothetical protein